MKRLIPILALLAGCGTATVSHPAVHHASPTPSAVSPQMQADKAMCKTFNANIGNGGGFLIAQALQNAGSTVSPRLRRDMMKAVNGTTLHGDLIAQVHVTMDCAMVHVGRTP